MGGRRTPDLTGQRFGRLVAQTPTQISGKMHWVCLCDCGNTCTPYAYSLVSGGTTSCGCAKRDRTITRNTKHGCAPRGACTPEYSAWQAMWARCTNPNNVSFKNYGGRGIGVCHRWKVFANFLADMGKKPTPEHTLERMNNEKDYSPSNCVWATHAEQCRNTRSNVLITAFGETLTRLDWAKRIGISTSTLADRLRRGWSVEEAVSTPAQHVGYKQRRAKRRARP